MVSLFSPFPPHSSFGPLPAADHQRCPRIDADASQRIRGVEKKAPGTLGSFFLLPSFLELVLDSLTASSSFSLVFTPVTRLNERPVQSGHPVLYTLPFSTLHPSFLHALLRPRLPVLRQAKSTHTPNVLRYSSACFDFGRYRAGYICTSGFGRRRHDCPATRIDAHLCRRHHGLQSRTILPLCRPFFKTPPHLDATSSRLSPAKAEGPA
jgi:hypothetical protein